MECLPITLVTIVCDERLGRMPGTASYATGRMLCWIAFIRSARVNGFCR